MEISKENLESMTTADISATLLLFMHYPGKVTLITNCITDDDGFEVRIALQNELAKRLNKVFIF